MGIPEKDERVRRAGVVVGGLLVAAGVVATFLLHGRVPWAYRVFSLLAGVLRFAAPVALVALVVYVVWAWRRGRFEGAALRAVAADEAGPSSLVRSASDRRFNGVCGGLASHFHVDSVSMRTIVLLAFFVLPLPVAAVYILLSAILPRG